MSMYPRLLGIAAVVFGFGLSEALAADDVWKGSWKFEIDRQDQPALSYYDTSGRRIFGIACGVHFEMNAVYPGAAPKEGQPPARSRSPTVRRRWTSPATSSTTPKSKCRPICRFSTRRSSALHPELNKDKWGALENRVFDLLDSGRPLTISAEGKSYVLPAVKVPRRRARFQKIC